jgi:hypothetical protein
MKQNGFYNTPEQLYRQMYNREDELIVPKEKGALNPVEKKTVTKIINVDSLFRENYESTSASNFIWNLAEPVKNVVAMKVVALELPTVWYSISSKLKNNKMIVHLYNVKDDTATTNATYHDETHVITVPDGNYMAPVFVTTMNNYLQNLPDTVNGKFNGLKFLYFDIDAITTRTTIRARYSTETGNSPYKIGDPYFSPDFYFEVDFNTIDETENNENAFKKTLGWFLGFRKSAYVVDYTNVYTDNITDSNGGVTYKYYLQSESSYGSTIQNYIYIDLNDFNRNESTDTFTAPTENGYIGNNVIARISISTLFNSTLFDNASDRVYKQRDYFGPVRISKMQIKLLNKFGDLIDLNYNDFSMALELTILYQ